MERIPDESSRRVGGLLECAALVTGYQTLLILVALLYGAAFLAGRVHLWQVAGQPRRHNG